MIGLAILFALVGLLVAVAFFMQSRTIRAEAAALAGRIDAAVAEAAAAQQALAAQKGELKEKREEAAAMRLKLDEVKKKAFDQAEAQKKLGGAVALREELDKLAARLAEARAESAHQVEAARAAEGARARAVQEAERLKAALDRKLAEPPPPVKAAPPPPPEGSVEAELKVKLAAETDRADKTEARLTELKKKLAEVEKELKTSRGKGETDRRVFIVQKGELDLAHDRYAELKKRNDQLRREHEELIEAVRQAAREERQQAEGKSTPASMIAEGAPASPAPAPAPAAAPEAPAPAAPAEPTTDGA
jgi:chromosome segregation ATPase